LTIVFRLENEETTVEGKRAMNESKRRPLGDCQQEERPMKRARTGSIDYTPDDNPALSQPAVYNIQNETQTRTGQCTAYQVGHNDNKIEMQEVASPSRLALSRNGKHKKGDQQNEKSTVETSQTPSLYKDQKQEYDEGMRFFKDHIPIEENIHTSVHSATMWYNTGQTHAEQGEYSEARKWFEQASLQLILNTKTNGASSLSLRINHNLGVCHYRLGNHEGAMRYFKTALEHVEQANLGAMAEASTLNCIGVLHFHDESSDPTRSLEMFEKSLAIYEKHCCGESPKVATVLNNIGRVHFQNGDYEEALKVYERALSIRRRHLGTHSLDVLATICNKGQAHHERGEFDSAVQYYQEFLQLANTHLGSIYQDVMSIINCIADIHDKRKDFDLARAMYEKGLNAARIAVEKFHPDVASILNKLGNLHYESRRYEMALKYYTECFEIEQVVRGACHPNVLVTLMNIAQIHRQRGDFHDALVLFTDVHTRAVKAYGPNSLEVANALSNIGLMQYQLKADEAALELYQNALRIQRDHHGSDENTDVASSLNSIGLVLFNKGVHDIANACFCDSLRIRRKVLGPNHRDVAIGCYNLATFHLEIGDKELAIEYYKETLRIERMILGPSHRDVIMTLQHLGFVHQQLGEVEDSLMYFDEALTIEKTTDGGRNVNMSKILNLMGNIHLQRANVAEMMTCYTEASRIYGELGQPQDGIVIAGYNFYGLSKLHPPSAQAA
jgi:tetratricopeptide (TPR) repeat protein